MPSFSAYLANADICRPPTTQGLLFRVSHAICLLAVAGRRLAGERFEDAYRYVISSFLLTRGRKGQTIFYGGLTSAGQAESALFPHNPGCGRDLCQQRYCRSIRSRHNCVGGRSKATLILGPVTLNSRRDKMRSDPSTTKV